MPKSYTKLTKKLFLTHSSSYTSFMTLNPGKSLMTAQIFTSFIFSLPGVYKQKASVMLLWRHRVLTHIETVTAGNLTADKRTSLGSMSIHFKLHFELYRDIFTFIYPIDSFLCHILSLTNKAFFSINFCCAKAFTAGVLNLF